MQRLECFAKGEMKRHEMCWRYWGVVDKCSERASISLRWKWGLVRFDGTTSREKTSNEVHDAPSGYNQSVLEERVKLGLTHQ